MSEDAFGEEEEEEEAEAEAEAGLHMPPPGLGRDASQGEPADTAMRRSRSEDEAQPMPGISGGVA